MRFALRSGADGICDVNDIPEAILKSGQRTYRSITINGAWAPIALLSVETPSATAQAL
jgi:hypothetical protein